MIAPVSSALAGTTVQLDGSQSTAFSGSSLRSYQWRQLSGPAIAIQNASAAVASITLPAAAGSFTFSLTVTDTAGRTNQNTVTVVSTTGTAIATASEGGGGGGGATSLLWGLALWAWVTAVWISRRRAQKANQQGT